MSHAIFLHSVHGELPHPPRGPIIENANGYIIPRAIPGVPFVAVSLNEQIEAAARDPFPFLCALHMLRPYRKPHHSKVLCPDVYTQGKCLNGRFCEFAGNLAELYANNVLKNPFYKTKTCKFKHCKLGAACEFGHVGDLMRRVRLIGKIVITDLWYVRRR